jgi:DNA-binding NarL/FixJ family response regulator
MTVRASGPIRVLVVDDHPLLREGVAAMIENATDIEVAGEASHGAQAIESFRELRPDVTLMDLQMPGLDGIEATRAIRAEFADARIVVLTTYLGDAQAVRALKAGASGYLLKSSLRTQVLDAIRNVHAGRRHIDHEVAQQVAMHIADEDLTARETEILKLVAVGQANKQVAWALGVSEETVKAHLKTIFAKLDVADRTHAVTVAIRRGIIDV